MGAAVDCVTTHAALAEGFERARRQCPEQLREAALSFAGHRVHLRCVGERLFGHVAPAFAHLTAPKPAPSRPRLRIDLWDGGETGVPCLDQREDPTTIAYHSTTDGRCVGMWRPDVIGTLDRHARRIVAFAVNREALPNYQRAKPFQFPLSVWYNDEGMQTVHAGLLARGARGVLIVGPGGAGKSTVCLAGLQDGFQYLGDDQIAIEPTPAGFTGHSLFGSMLVESRFGAGFEELREHGVPGTTLVYGAVGSREKIEVHEKTLVQLAEIFPDRVRASVPIKAIVISDFQPGRTETTWSPATRVEAFMALVPSTLESPSNSLLVSMPIVSELIGRTPCYRLRSGPSLPDVARCVDEILKAPAS